MIEDILSTRQQIEKMEVGREIDIMIHKHVFNKCPHKITKGMGKDFSYFKCSMCGQIFIGDEYCKSELICPKYSTEIEDTSLIIEANKKNFLINFMTPDKGFGYGWHCNINSVHVRGCSTMQEAVAKASLINALNLHNESEQYQKEKKKACIDGDIKKMNELCDVIKKLEEDKLYTKEQIIRAYGYLKNI